MSNSKLKLVWDNFVLVLIISFFLINIYSIPCSKCSSCVKFICDLFKVPNWCLVIIGIMNQVDQNINKDMFDSDLIDVESLDYSDDQTWWVPLKSIWVGELWSASLYECKKYGVMYVSSGRHVSAPFVSRWLLSLFQLIVKLFISSLTTPTSILT